MVFAPAALLLAAAPQAVPQERVVTEDLALAEGEVLTTPLVVAADGITIEGNGATIRGPGRPGELETLRGTGIRLEGRKGVTIRNLKVHGFEIGLRVTNCTELVVEGCDFSDNYHDPDHGWGDGERNGGIILTRVDGSTFRDNHANRVWNGIDLWECDDNTIEKNDFSHCSNVCCKLWDSDRNRVIDNDLSWGLRMKPGDVIVIPRGVVHNARCVSTTDAETIVIYSSAAREFEPVAAGAEKTQE